MTIQDLYKAIQKAINDSGGTLTVDGFLGSTTLEQLRDYKLTITAKKVNQARVEPVDNSALSYNMFFTEVAKHFKFSVGQNAGVQALLQAWDLAGLTDPRWLAYILGTAYHESATTMKPVHEMGGESYLRSKPYYPYYGRGVIQITWEWNYAKYGIANTPEKAMDTAFSAHIAVDGMTKGIFTGKALKNYFNANLTDPYNARRIINGVDKAEEIVGWYNKFLPACEVLHNQPVTVKS